MLYSCTYVVTVGVKGIAYFWTFLNYGRALWNTATFRLRKPNNFRVGCTARERSTTERIEHKVCLSGAEWSDVVRACADRGAESPWAARSEEQHPKNRVERWTMIVALMLRSHALVVEQTSIGLNFSDWRQFTRLVLIGLFIYNTCTEKNIVRVYVSVCAMNTGLHAVGEWRRKELVSTVIAHAGLRANTTDRTLRGCRARLLFSCT